MQGGAYLFLSGSKSEQPIRNEPLKVQKAVIKLPEHDPLKELLDLNKDFFDGLLNYPLTHDQRVSILDSGKRNLVLASAGCGKTSVLIAKLAYLHIQEGVPLNKILLLAFNSSVRKELQERLNQIGVADAEIHTFHSFGLNVLKHHSENVMLDKNSSEDTSGVISTNFVRRLISESLPQHPDLFRKVLEFRALCRHHSIYKLANSMQEYNELMLSFPYKRSRTRINDDNRYLTLPALGGRYNVKSQQELLIANWLILNGIEHKYEAVFNKVDYKYTPDFYIPEANLWIEHFAIDRDGSSPFEGYVDDANQKKELHQSLNSNLECTYSYEYYEDTIIDKLKSIMKKNDVPLKPLSDKQVQNLLDVMEVDTFFRYIAEMLRLIKANIISVNEIPEKLSNLEDKFRANRFKEIIVPIFNSYENYLSKEKTIDFEDMILKAVNLLKTNENNEFKYSHILVDEFQDLSMARKNLLKSLLDLDDGELFGVGDDWQSINRFTGADVSLTLDFDTYFEYKFFKKRQSDAEESEFLSYDLTFQPPKIFSVAQTHRCSKNISNIASDFITMNPYQWSKDIESKQTRNPKIKFQTMDEYKTKHVITLINRIPKPNTTESIFVLYPYNRISKN